MNKRFFLLICMLILFLQVRAAYIFIPMDKSQKNHLKAYGITYWVLQNDIEVSWLLNYRGGSFMCKQSKLIETECAIRGVSYDLIADVQASAILQEISDPKVNMDEIKLVKAPKVAVYSPKTKQPWDDAVTLVLKYAEIPYTLVYDEEVLQGTLPLYDWLHLHHEDFTGQYGKFWAAYQGVAWYIQDVKANEEIAKQLGYSKVSQMKLAVAKKIRDFVAGGGYLFAMCSAPDSYDIALAADGVDICQSMFDGDGADPKMQSKINYDNCFAFTGFSLEKSPQVYAISNIDVTHTRNVLEKNDFFVLFGSDYALPGP
jgi:hypothetical protein